MNPLTTPLFVKDLLEHDRRVAYLVFGTTLQATEECRRALANVSVGTVTMGMCEAGNRDLAEWLAGEREYDYDWALQRACKGGYRDLAEWLVEETTARNWNTALYGACYGGNRDIAEWLVERGARDWDEALQGACYGGHRGLAEWALESGANQWHFALAAACEGGHRDLAEWLLEKWLVEKGVNGGASTSSVRANSPCR